MTLVGTGTLLGALCGLAHAAYVYSVVVSADGTESSQRTGEALYAAVWTLLLWLLLGTYLLIFWLLGGLLMLLSRAWR